MTPETLLLKLENKEVWEQPHWELIAHVKDEELITEAQDDEIYFFVEDDVDFNSIKIGDTIELDKTFKIVDSQ